MTEIFTSSDPNFWNYVRLKDFTKKTGIEAKDCHAFCIKELSDNAGDFIEKYRYSNAVIVLDIINDNKKGIMTISVNNSNFRNITTFDNITQTFNYKRSYSSKSNQYKVTRGAQGDAIKEFGPMGYMLLNSEDSEEEDKAWNYPIIFQHNKKIEKVYIDIDRKHREIVPRFEESGTCDSTDTKVTITLPAVTEKEYDRLKKFCFDYVLFNTHLSFHIYYDGKPYAILKALHPISEHYENPNSVYCYSITELWDFLSDIYEKNISIYEALSRSGFREIRQQDRFDDFKNITIEQLTSHDVKTIHARLRNSMLPMSKLSLPYTTKIMKRKEALLNRIKQMWGDTLDLEYDKAKYERTKDLKHDFKDLVYNNGIIKYPWYFEILAIPIKNRTGGSRIISGVNYSTSINNLSYFKSDGYEDGYKWSHKNGTRLRATNIEEIIRVSSAGADITWNDNVPSNKQRQSCMIIAHLVSQRPEYKRGYGKSQLQLNSYSKQIAETIELLVRKIPLQNRINYSREYKGVTACLDELLQRRWDDVRHNPKLLDKYSSDYDPWTQSTVWYHLREEYLLPVEREYGVVMIKANTRSDVTSMINERCEKLEESPTREQLGIFASPRATMYVNGRWHRVDIDDIPELAGKGTDVVFIEKQGVVEIVKDLADIYGIAFVNTQGHFADYPRALVPEIIETGGNVVILTDYDCAGIHIAERIIAEDIYVNYIGSEGNISLEPKDGYSIRYHYGERVKRIGIDFGTLDYLVSKANADNKTSEIESEIKVKIMVKNGSDGSEFIEKSITTKEELQKYTEEPYPKAEDKDRKQQPGMNVITPLVRYARKYLLSTENQDLHEGDHRRFAKYERYKYVYDNFEYLTGLNVEEVMKTIGVNEDKEDLESNEKSAINKLLQKRDPKKAKRIELDSVIKVVRANLFSDFILDQLQHLFASRKYTRAISLPTEYFGDKFHILPQNIKRLFLYYVEAAEKALESTEEKIVKELDYWAPTENQIKRGIPRLLKTHDENALIEMLTSKAVADNAEMQALDKKVFELLNSLPPLNG
jgi:hypothetical protein